MKKTLLALLLLLPLAGCAHQGGGYAGGGAGYFYDDECLYPDGCYRPGYFYYFDGTQTSRVVERARVTKAQRIEFHARRHPTARQPRCCCRLHLGTKRSARIEPAFRAGFRRSHRCAPLENEL